MHLSCVKNGSKLSPTIKSASYCRPQHSTALQPYLFRCWSCWQSVPLGNPSSSCAKCHRTIAGLRVQCCTWWITAPMLCLPSRSWPRKAWGLRCQQMQNFTVKYHDWDAVTQRLKNFFDFWTVRNKKQYILSCYSMFGGLPVDLRPELCENGPATAWSLQLRPDASGRALWLENFFV